MLSRALFYRRDYVLRLVRGEDVFTTIAAFCEKEGISHGTFRAIGAVEKSKIGYYDLPTKKYGQKEYADAMEVASMTGNIALVEGKPFIHCHAVLSGITLGTENQPVGGHVFEAVVAVTLEVHLEAYDVPVTRELDEEIGLKLLDL